MLFRMAPYLVCVASFGAFMVLPFSDGWVAVESDVGLFLMLAILSLEVVRHHSRRLFQRLEMVAVRRHARSGADGELRNSAGDLRDRSGDCRRVR